MINVMTADDHALIRKGIRHILGKTSDVRVVDEAESGRQLLNKLKDAVPDVLVLDLSMPDMDIFELMRKVKNRAPRMPILVLSMYPEKQYGVQMLKAGAAGYLNKSSGLNDLVAAIRRVYNGKRFISRALAEKLADRLLQEKEGRAHEHLSQREFQVMCLLAGGRTVTEIADQLCLSIKTISTYRRRLLGKMNFVNNAQLTRYAIQNQLCLKPGQPSDIG